MRGTVQGWQGAGQRFGIPVDLEADRALTDAARYLTDAKAALDPATGMRDPLAAGVFVSVDMVGRTRVQAASTAADRSRLVRDSRRFAATVRPSVRGLMLYEAVRAFGEAVKFRGLATAGLPAPRGRATEPR